MCVACEGLQPLVVSFSCLPTPQSQHEADSILSCMDVQVALGKNTSTTHHISYLRTRFCPIPSAEPYISPCGTTKGTTKSTTHNNKNTFPKRNTASSPEAFPLGMSRLRPLGIWSASRWWNGSIVARPWCGSAPAHATARWTSRPVAWVTGWLRGGFGSSRPLASSATSC